MCGVSASIPADQGFMRHAIDSQVARGPDETELHDLGFAALGINRLAISGLSGGSQPLRSASGHIEVVFNGAIYNAQRLADRHGWKLPSMNDGEIIAPLYETYGAAFADHLEGMFAICVADRSRERLVVAVDPIGIKPLYVIFDGPGRLRCASEIQAFPQDVRRRAVRVPAGTVLSSDGCWRRVRRAEWVEGDLIQLIRASVREQLPQEVQWGCMLSGGIDSSLVAQLATEAVGRIRTITCGLRGGSDVQAGAQMAMHLGSDHHEVLVDRDELPDVVGRVVDATASMEPWTIMSGVGTYLVAREARKLGMKVLLSGEGADELFAGYDEFQSLPDIFLEPVLAQYQADLGVSECLRLDRCTMANSIEARVPFLSTSIIRHARRLPPSMKIRRTSGASVRKHALRVAASSVLPAAFADRTKEEFGNGSGISAAVRDLAERSYSSSKTAQIAREHPSFGISSPSHAWFFDLWKRRFGNTIGDDWNVLVERGLFRQSVSRYLPPGGDAFLYGPVAEE